MKNLVIYLAFTSILFSCKDDDSLISNTKSANFEPDLYTYLPQSSSSSSKGARIIYRKPNGLVVQTITGELKLFPFINGTFYGYSRGVVGTNWVYGKNFAADWNNDGKTDLIGKDGAGNLYFAPFINGKFEKQQGDVGTGFNSPIYTIGEWGTPSGADPDTPDLMGINFSGNITIYPFKYYSNFRNGTFQNGGSFSAGTIPTNYTHYFVADWSGDGLSDMICRDSDGLMHYYIFQNNQFIYKDLVGHGWFFTHYFIVDENMDGIADGLFARNTLGELKRYSFNNQTFYGNNGGSVIGTGFNYSHYFVGYWSPTRNLYPPQIIGRDLNGNMYYHTWIAEYGNSRYSNPILVGHAWNFNDYYMGTW